MHCPPRLLAVALILALPAAARAQSAVRDDSGSQFGITIWGLSYHVNRGADYNEDNWGLGLRYYNRPEWRWLGSNRNNRVFLEADALRNSNRGLVVPVSAAVEYQIAPLPGPCSLLAVGALALAYYQYPAQNRTEIKFGPVPGIDVGCGHLHTNVIVVLRKSSEPIAAITASLTIGF